MQRDDVLNVLTGQRQELPRFGIKSLAIFARLLAVQAAPLATLTS